MKATSISLAGQTAVVATMHGKEQVIAPAVAAGLGLQTILPTGFDSDRFGTFTRDIPRAGSQLEAARQKALAAMDLTGCSIGLASEGAFGPDPAVPWVACDRELIVLIDRPSGLELVGEAVSTATNYGQTTVTTLAEALQFAASVQFPSHALVVRPSANSMDSDTLHKGIQDEASLRRIVSQLLAAQGSLWLETDMRAHLNPSRMAVIAQAACNLVQKFQQACPACGWPGFDVTRRLPGLPCASCGLPTALTHPWVYRCLQCCHEQEVLFPTGLQMADPGQCSFCNP